MGWGTTLLPPFPTYFPETSPNYFTMGILYLFFFFFLACKWKQEIRLQKSGWVKKQVRHLWHFYLQLIKNEFESYKGQTSSLIKSLWSPQKDSTGFLFLGFSSSAISSLLNLCLCTSGRVEWNGASQIINHISWHFGGGYFKKLILYCQNLYLKKHSVWLNKLNGIRFTGGFSFLSWTIFKEQGHMHLKLVHKWVTCLVNNLPCFKSIYDV